MIWPWEDKQNPKAWRKMKTQTILTLFFYHFILTIIFLKIDILIGIKFRYDLETFPTKFFWGHYFLHSGFLYNKIHKWHHEYKTPISIVAEYSNPFEYVFGNMVPALAFFKIMRNRSHLFTQIGWLIWRLYSTSDVHSGFEIPWNPIRIFPMSSTYGSFFTFWDHVMKTDKQFYIHRNRIFSQTEKTKKN